jgi:outer membrane protein TolC
VTYRAETFRIAQLSYNEQAASYTEVLDAESQLSVSEGDYVTAQIGSLINKAVPKR